ncbi:MAG: glycosyltransferase [Planctomycetes bacterium]|nr:glycosyltransferase [Planctomycetota bacterium]
MHPALEAVCVLAFLVLTTGPGLYGVHLLLLSLLTHRRRTAVRQHQREVVERFHAQVAEEDWPRVTTQIPLYNELPVARRVIEAVARMDYPAGRHEVQVLDDSTDETCRAVDEVCAALRQQGHDVTVVRRPTRENYKAGALAHGMERARGEYLAIFDADFVPNPGFLRRLIPLIATQERACCVQGRWGHLNADESWLTKALALGIDGHFGIEQAGRGWNGFLLNFNGTGGIWRRAAIEDPQVGGWQGDTITEDLDLSYRAQLSGWKIIYCADEVCPAEVPADVDAVKTQQRRWATGSMQTARKLLPAVWRSQLTFWQKLEGTLHLTSYCISLFMVLVPLFARPLLWLITPETQQRWFAWIWFLLPVLISGPSIAYVYARWSLGGGLSGVRHIVHLIVLGLGLSVNNCAAVLQGLVQHGGEFIRTPKSGSAGRRAGASPYQALRSRLWLFELALGGCCFVQWLVFLRSDRYIGGIFLLLYAIGLCSFGWASRPRAARPGSPTVVPTAPELEETAAFPRPAR